MRSRLTLLPQRGCHSRTCRSLLGRRMLHLLDHLLRDVLISRIAGLVEDQVRFEPPDEEFRSYVSNLPTSAQLAGALNIYLVELRENRMLRSNQRIRQN